MKSQSNKKPPIFHDLKDGTLYYNYNINEVSVVSENGEESTIFHYETVHVNSIAYDIIVSAIIREEYDIDRELSILRQREDKAEQFLRYNSFCEGVKKMVKNDLMMDLKLL